jgi:hypothetical protein
MLVPNNSQKEESLMKQNINKNSSDSEKFTNANLANSLQERSLPPDDMAQKNKELKHERARYLNRMLEACCDCV